MERLNFTWQEWDDEGGECEQNIDFDDYATDLNFVHEACFTILVDFLKQADPEEDLIEAFSLEDLLSIVSVPLNGVDEERVPELPPWPYCDLLPTLPEAEAWKVRALQILR
jgi:hypothetical protein